MIDVLQNDNPHQANINFIIQPLLSSSWNSELVNQEALTTWPRQLLLLRPIKIIALASVQLTASPTNPNNESALLYLTTNPQ